MIDLKFYPIFHQKVSLSFPNNNNREKTKASTEAIDQTKKEILKNQDPNLFCNLGIEFGRQNKFQKSTKAFHLYFLSGHSQININKLWLGYGHHFNLYQHIQYGESLSNLIWIPILKKANHEFTYVCNDALNRLISETKAHTSVEIINLNDIYEHISDSNQLFSFASPCPNSLANALGVDSIDFPYFLINHQNIKSFIGKYSVNLEKLRIGICWESGIKTSNRNFFVNDLSPLLNINNIEIISLQKGEATLSLQNSLIYKSLVKNQNLLNLSKDFYETLLAIYCCNIVITCDTSVAHLAGLSGIPTVLLLNDLHDDRWGNSEMYPLYPNLRIIRKISGKTFKDLIEEISLFIRFNANMLSQCSIF
jgi:hypothetical protein